jgi:hypothetical protein
MFFLYKKDNVFGDIPPDLWQLRIKQLSYDFADLSSYFFNNFFSF